MSTQAWLGELIRRCDWTADRFEKVCRLWYRNAEQFPTQFEELREEKRMVVSEAVEPDTDQYLAEQVEQNLDRVRLIIACGPIARKTELRSLGIHADAIRSRAAELVALIESPALRDRLSAAINAA